MQQRGTAPNIKNPNIKIPNIKYLTPTKANLNFMVFHTKKYCMERKWKKDCFITSRIAAFFRIVKNHKIS